MNNIWRESGLSGTVGSSIFVPLFFGSSLLNAPIAVPISPQPYSSPSINYRSATVMSSAQVTAVEVVAPANSLRSELLATFDAFVSQQVPLEPDFAGYLAKNRWSLYAS